MSIDTATEKDPQSVQNVERKGARITSNITEIGFVQKLQPRLKRNGGNGRKKKKQENLNKIII